MEHKLLWSANGSKIHGNAIVSYIIGGLAVFVGYRLPWLLTFGIFLIAEPIVRAMTMEYSITDIKVSCKKGILFTTKSEVEIKNIRDVVIKNNLLSSSLEVSTAGRSGAEIAMITLAPGEAIKAKGILDGLLKSIDEKHKSLQDNERTCPFCAETIKKEAKLCRYCGKDLLGTQS